MGRFSLLGMIAMAGEDTALTWHLQANVFPPVPLAFASTARIALLAMRADQPDTPVDLPPGYAYSPKGVHHETASTTMPARLVITALHLEAFLEADDDFVEA
jgi:hypothetical protein